MFSQDFLNEHLRMVSPYFQECGYLSNRGGLFTCYIYIVLAPCNAHTTNGSYLFSLSFSNIAITSGCVGVNLIPRFNIPITFRAFCSISLAVCSLVSIR